MSASLSGVFSLQEFTDGGALLVGGRIYTYITGTTTFKTAYTDAAALVPHTYVSDGQGGQYIALNARGELPADLYLTSGSYDIALKRADGSTIWTRRADPIADLSLSNDPVSVESYVTSGMTDYSAAIVSAISAASAAGGGEVKFGAGKTYTFGTPFLLAPNVRLNLNGATLQFTGTGVAAVASSTASILSNAGIRNGIIDAGASGTFPLQLCSPYHCSFENLTLKSNNATCIALAIEVNTSGGTNADSNRNAVFNLFSNILQDGICGTALRLKGNTSGTTVVTLNTFVNFNARGASVKGIDFDSWCDSNYFAGVTRLQIVANNGLGVVWNSGTPAGNVGVYSNNFDHLAVDTFAGPTGRIGIQMNWTKLNKVNYYFNDPPAEGGAFVTTANTQSYSVYHQVGLTSNLILRQKLSYASGQDNPFLLVTGPDISTETVGIEVGLGRTGSGFAYIDLIGDTTYTAYGLRLIRNSGGANTSSVIQHRGTGNFSLQCQDAGSQIILQNNGVTRLVTNDTGIGFYGSAGVAQSTAWGTPTGNAKLANFPGATATLAQTTAQLAQLIIDLKAVGLLGA